MVHDKLKEIVNAFKAAHRSILGAEVVRNNERPYAVLEVSDGAENTLNDPIKELKKVLHNAMGHEVQVLITTHKESPQLKHVGKPVDMPNAKKIIAIASGKGGVGKSTVACNLAIALAQQGHQVGLLDGDIYGPSIPTMMNLKNPPDTKDHKFVPPISHGVKCISMGLLLQETMPLVWRGPMAQKAFGQLFQDVNWGDLDYLLIDLPPGTGDIQLSLAQKVPVDGAIIVSTPQDIALQDVRRGIEMFQKVDIPVLGLVENMSLHVCDNCGHESHLFGHDLSEEAAKYNIPLLAQLPLDRSLRESMDAGRPLATENKNHKISKMYQQLAENIL